MGIKAALFDKDGTIADFEANVCSRYPPCP